MLHLRPLEALGTYLAENVLHVCLEGVVQSHRSTVSRRNVTVSAAQVRRVKALRTREKQEDVDEDVEMGERLQEGSEEALEGDSVASAAQKAKRGTRRKSKERKLT